MGISSSDEVTIMTQAYTMEQCTEYDVLITDDEYQNFRQSSLAITHKIQQGTLQ